MIKNCLLITIVCLTIGALVIFNCTKINEKAKYATKEAIVEIERYVQNNAKFPEDIDRHLKEKGIKTNVKMGLLSSKISVLKQGENYKIEYHEKPFGPFSGYDFDSKEWYFTE
jgi:hypothetical protein